MNILSLFSAKAIGPVWPAMLICFAFMLVTSVFLVLARLRAWFRAFTLREVKFMQRLFDATEMFSTLAILSGMIGTCMGLLQVLPVLGESLQQIGSETLLANVFRPLENVWTSTIAGLALGGLWGEIVLFTLKPYTRPALLPLTTADSEHGDNRFIEPEPPEDPADDDIDNDWRQNDAEGMYG